MTFGSTKIFVIRLFQTSRNIFLFKLNGVLANVAMILGSETVDNIRINYGNWYNLQLMRKFIECDYYIKNRHILLTLKSMETIGSIVIAQVEYSGMTKVEMSDYLTNSISGSIPATLSNIQISNIDDAHAKIIFPL